ncbi:MAG: glycosyltransferase family 4 protein [Bacillota bacterium]
MPGVKIGFFSDSYHPYMSGVVRSIEDFTRHLRQRGHEVYIFAPDYPGVDGKEDNIFRFPSLPAVTNKSFRLAIPYSMGITEKVKELELDIIHSHSPFLLGRLALRLADKLDLPLVFTYHTLYDRYTHYVPGVSSLATRLVEKYVHSYCRRSDLVLTPSPFVRDMLGREGMETPLRVQPTGVDLFAYAEASGEGVRGEFGIGEDEDLLIFVGRLGQEKNLEFLLECGRLLLESAGGGSESGGGAGTAARTGNRQRRLLLVGGGPERENLEDLACKLGIKEQVIFAGHQPPERVKDLYAAADLLVFPSLTETQGLVLLEAMATGLPVVAIDAGGVSAVVDSGENGFLVGEDRDEFCRAVDKLLADRDLYSAAAKKARTVAKEYSMENMTGSLLGYYRELLPGSGAEIIDSV